MLKIQPKSSFVGKNQIYLTSCHSTNDIASEKIQNREAIDGTVIVTDHQTAGRGQRGNQWQSDTGKNVLMSIIVFPDFLKFENHFNLSICTAVSIFETLSFFSNQNIKIKWPNDMYINEKKVGGVLIETGISGQKFSHAIVGIGLNILQTEFENPKSTSLAVQNPEKSFNRDRIIEKLLEVFEENYFLMKENKTSVLKEKYMENLLWLNEEKKFSDSNGPFGGKIVDVINDGRLKIEVENKIKYYDIKEITYVFND